VEARRARNGELARGALVAEISAATLCRGHVSWAPVVAEPWVLRSADHRDERDARGDQGRDNGGAAVLHVEKDKEMRFTARQVFDCWLRAAKQCEPSADQMEFADHLADELNMEICIGSTRVWGKEGNSFWSVDKEHMPKATHVALISGVETIEWLEEQTKDARRR